MNTAKYQAANFTFGIGPNRRTGEIVLGIAKVRDPVARQRQRHRLKWISAHSCKT